MSTRLNTPIDKELIPKEIYNVKLSDDQLNEASLTGELFIKGIVQDGTINDGLVTFRQRSKEVISNFIPKQEKMNVPDLLGDHRFSPEQKDYLKKFPDQFLGPLTINKIPNLYVRMDTRSQTLTIKTGKEVGIPNKIMNYELTPADKFALAKGEKMDAKIYKTDDGKYFSVRFTLDKVKGQLSFDMATYKDLDSKTGEKLIKEMNNANRPVALLEPKKDAKKKQEEVSAKLGPRSMTFNPKKSKNRSRGR